MSEIAAENQPITPAQLKMLIAAVKAARVERNDVWWHMVKEDPRGRDVPNWKLIPWSLWRDIIDMLEHRDAYRLIKYEHERGGEWIWNSRNGGVPACITIEGIDMVCGDKRGDKYDPAYTPKVGDYIFVDTTYEVALGEAQALLKSEPKEYAKWAKTHYLPCVKPSTVTRERLADAMAREMMKENSENYLYEPLNHCCEPDDQSHLIDPGPMPIIVTVGVLEWLKKHRKHGV